MRKLWETGMLLFAVAGFWGMIYPDFCFISDVCRVEAVSEAADGGQEERGQDAERFGRDDVSAGTQGAEGRDRACEDEEETDMYTRICEAEPGQIRLKCKLLEMFRN